MINVSQAGGRRLGCFPHNVTARYASDWRLQGPSAKPTRGVLETNISHQTAGDLHLEFHQYPTWFIRGTGSRSFIVYAVSMIFRGQTRCSTYRFHHHQTDNILCRYRIDAVFSSFLSAHSEEKCIVLCLVVPRQMESPIRAASLQGRG